MTPSRVVSVRWPEALLDSMREDRDPPADNVVRQLFADNDIRPVNALMAQLVRDDEVDPRTLPPIVSEFLEASSQLPSWADRSLIQAGESLFWDFGESMITALFCYSLPFCYLGRNGVQVLALTAR